MLVIRQRDPLAHRGVDVGGDLVVAHGEGKDLRHAAGQGDDGQLAFPGLAQPALLGKLLYVAGAFAAGVAPVEGQPGVADQQGDDQEEEADEPQEPVPALAGAGGRGGCHVKLLLG